MPDIFDTLAPEQEPQSGDIFDQIAEPKGDIFDQVSEQSQPSATPETDKALNQSREAMRPKVEWDDLKQNHPRIYGFLEALSGIIPKSLEDVKSMVTLPMPSQDVEKERQASEQWGAAVRGEFGPAEQTKAITGTALQALPLAHLPFAKSPLKAVPRDLALVEQLKKGGEPDASRITSTESVPELEVRPQVGEETSLRQQGETAGAQEQPVPASESVAPETSEGAHGTGVAGDLWYQGVSKEGVSPWVTHDINIAKSYASRRGEGAKINVYTPGQVGETAFADPEGNLISPQEYAKHNWSTTIQTGGKELPKPIKTLPAATSDEPNAPRSLEADLSQPSGISTERLQELYGKDAVIINKGKGAKAWQAAGEADKRDPYALLTQARRRGIAPPEDVAKLRNEHQKLLSAARQSYGTPAYPQLAQYAADFANAVKSVAHGPASDVMRALQEVDVPKYDSPADFDSIIRERMQRESTPKEQETFGKISNELKNGDTEVKNTASDAQQRLKRYLPKDEVSFEQAVDHVRKQIEELTKPCQL